MHELTKLIYDDRKPALGVTEPGAIAFAVAKAKEYTEGELLRVTVALNSGMYKNAFTCGIPNSARFGNAYAAALGAVAARADLGLESLAHISPKDDEIAAKLVEDGKVSVILDHIGSEITIDATVETAQDSCTVFIRGSHTHIVKIEKNGEVVFEENSETSAIVDSGSESCKSKGDARLEMRDSTQRRFLGEMGFETKERAPEQNPAHENGEVSKNIAVDEGADVATEEGADVAIREGAFIHRYSLCGILSYIKEVPIEEIAFLYEAFPMNLALLEEGIASERTSITKQLLESNGGNVISGDALRTAQLLCNGAIEARVLGLSRPAMSITGSGAHGIIATMPLYAWEAVRQGGEVREREMLLRATALSYLITMYIKEYSGKLSAFCGCGIAAGTGMACGLAYLRGASEEQMEMVVRNMASGLTGMICDGGNHGCTMKGIVATDAAFRAVDLALAGISIAGIHGINGETPEDTMRYMGRIASPGMVQTEETIVGIMQQKMFL